MGNLTLQQAKQLLEHKRRTSRAARVQDADITPEQAERIAYEIGVQPKGIGCLGWLFELLGVRL
jgi:hypothetical protein